MGLRWIELTQRETMSLATVDGPHGNCNALTQESVMPKIYIPANGWKPRSYQMKAWAAWEKGVRRSLLVWHRRIFELARMN